MTHKGKRLVWALSYLNPGIFQVGSGQVKMKLLVLELKVNKTRRSCNVHVEMLQKSDVTKITKERLLVPNG